MPTINKYYDNAPLPHIEYWRIAIALSGYALSRYYIKIIFMEV